MGDKSDSISSVSSIESTPDDPKTDPTFTCRVKIVSPKVVRKSKRIVKSIVDLGSKSLSAVESKNNQTNTKSNKKIKSVPSQVLKKSSKKMVYTCKNNWSGECGTRSGCYCYCENDKEGDCENNCMCMGWEQGDSNVGAEYIPITGDMGLLTKMGLSDSIKTKGSATGDSGSKSVSGGVAGTGTPGPGPIPVPGA